MINVKELNTTGISNASENLCVMIAETSAQVVGAWRRGRFVAALQTFVAEHHWGLD